MSIQKILSQSSFAQGRQSDLINTQSQISVVSYIQRFTYCSRHSFRGLVAGRGGSFSLSLFLSLSTRLFRDSSLLHLVGPWFLEFSPGFSAFGVQGREGACRVSREVSGRFWKWPVFFEPMFHGPRWQAHGPHIAVIGLGSSISLLLR